MGYGTTAKSKIRVKMQLARIRPITLESNTDEYEQGFRSVDNTGTQTTLRTRLTVWTLCL